jgi:hypothetical protein
MALRSRQPRAIGVALLALALTTPAAAQQTDAPTALELFRQGREALAEKNYPVACAKFEESVRLDPHVGPMVSLAECEEAQNHLARAWTYWQQAVDLARTLGDARQAVAKRHFDEIDARVPRLTLRRPPNAPPGLVVRRDDVEVAEVSLDVPLPVEVGPHALTVSAPGFVTNTMTVNLREGEAKVLDLEPGTASPEPPPPAPAEPTRIEALGVPKRTSPLRAIGLTTGGAGLLALGVGSVFGIEVIAAKSQPRGSCGPTPMGCDPQGNARNGVLNEGDASTALFVAGGALVATGVALWLLAPSNPETQAAGRVLPRIGAASLALEGTF